MCGIVGSWSVNGVGDAERQGLARGLKTLEHRGPDGHGTHIDEAVGLAMGHTRLSIIDLKTGEQPLCAKSGGVVLTVNGEFYDYKPTRADLSTRGRRFSTKSDSEIALHLYLMHGIDFVEHLRGEFAFALYDAGKDRLLLVRDRFGIKPLYFYADTERVVYASEIKAILEQPGVPRRLSRPAVLNQMMHTMVPGTTAFESVHAVKPGHVVIVQRGSAGLAVEQRRYWDMDFPLAGEFDEARPAEEWVDDVRGRLIDAVRVRLEADVPVGCYLSGGIDSCSMLGLAAPMQQSPVKAFTISFDDDQYDEAAIAREMGKSVDADHEILNLEAADLYGDYYAKTVWHAERTFYNTLGVAKWHMSRRVRQCGFKVVVTGEGSDEMFAGYPFFKRDYLLHDTRASGADEQAGVFQGAILAEERASHPAFDELCGFTPSWIQPWLLTLRDVRPLLSSDVREELAGYDPVGAIAEAIDGTMLAGRHPLDKAQYTWIKTMLEGQILTWGGDRVDMANSMESRPAFLDHHVAELARRIPHHYRINDGTEKWVLREAMKGILPRVLYERPKFAFMAPPSHTDPAKRAAASALADRWLAPDRIRRAGLFDTKAVEGFLESHARTTEPTRARRQDIILNHLLCLQILDGAFIARDADRVVEPIP